MTTIMSRRSSGTSRSASPALSGFALCCGLHTLGTLAAVRPDEQLEIFRPVVVGDLLARHDRADRAQDHLALPDRAFGIGPAGMVGIAADIAALRAVDGPAAVDLEHVAGTRGPLAHLGLTRRNAFARIFDDECAALDRSGRKQAEPGRRAANPVAGVAPARHAAASVVCLSSGKQSQILTMLPYPALLSLLAVVACGSTRRSPNSRAALPLRIFAFCCGDSPSAST